MGRRWPPWGSCGGAQGCWGLDCGGVLLLRAGLKACPRMQHKRSLLGDMGLVHTGPCSCCLVTGGQDRPFSLPPPSGPVLPQLVGPPSLQKSKGRPGALSGLNKLLPYPGTRSHPHPPLPHFFRPQPAPCLLSEPSAIGQGPGGLRASLLLSEVTGAGHLSLIVPASKGGMGDNGGGGFWVGLGDGASLWYQLSWNRTGRHLPPGDDQDWAGMSLCGPGGFCPVSPLWGPN